MHTSDIVDAPTSITTTTMPLVERWDTEDAGTIYVLWFEDAGVSVRLTEEQVRRLGARILSATLHELDG
jgi:hypothetical protein